MSTQTANSSVKAFGKTIWMKISGDGTWEGTRKRALSPVGIVSLVGVVLVALVGFSLIAANANHATAAANSNSNMNMNSSSSSGDTSGVPNATTFKGAQPAQFTTDSDGAKHFTLTAERVMWEVVKGKRVLAWTFDGMVPGPTIHVVAGDHVRLTIVNKLPEPTSVHWHGLLVPYDQDGVPGVGQKPIAAGATYTYEFTFHDDNYGTFAYHSHYDDMTQVGGGMYGAFLVDPKPGTAAANNEPKVQEDYLQMISELNGYYVINGHSFPDTDVLTVHHGDNVRLRFINMGEMIHPMHLHGHNMSVIFKDGNFEPSPEIVNTIAIAPGETADAIFNAWADPGSIYPLHCHILAHVMNPGQTGTEMGGLISIIQYAK